MTVFKRGNIYWTEFVYKGNRIRESTGATTEAKAAEYETNLRRELHEQIMLGRVRESDPFGFGHV